MSSLPEVVGAGPPSVLGLPDAGCCAANFCDFAHLILEEGLGLIAVNGFEPGQFQVALEVRFWRLSDEQRGYARRGCGLRVGESLEQVSSAEGSGVGVAAAAAGVFVLLVVKWADFHHRAILPVLARVLHVIVWVEIDFLVAVAIIALGA